MRKKRERQIGLRLDAHVLLYLLGMPGSNDAEKLRQLVDFGIEYRDKMRALMDGHFLSAMRGEGKGDAGNAS